MRSRALIATLLASSLFGSVPALALEPHEDETASVSHAHAAAVASSTVAEPGAPRSHDAQRTVQALPAPAWVELAVARLHVAQVAPAVFAARPDVVTCPAQGPPPAQ